MSHMPNSNSPDLAIDRPKVQQKTTRRWFPYVLLAIALAALIPMLVLGASEFISYDGYWYLFIATQNSWKQFLAEYGANAHPILYFLLLRCIGLLKHSRLVLRSGSIIPSAASIYVIGLTAAKLCRNKGSALLAAAAYGFSMVMIEIAVDVRSYPLCLFFVLTAFYFLVDFLDRDFGPLAARSLVLFGVFTSAAIGTEYYAVFFLLACMAVLSMVFVRSDLRHRAIYWTAENWVAPFAAFSLPIATIAFFYWTHIRHQPLMYGHLTDFYWTPGSSKIDFILRNLRSDLNYISPLQIVSTQVLVAVLATAVPAIVIFAFFQVRSRGTVSAGIPGLIALVITAELIAVSLLRRYPFGGFERQQSILFPFLILAGFILLDRALSYLPAAWLRASVFGVCAVLIGINFHYQWLRTPRRSEELLTREYQTFKSKAAPAEAIYLDQFSLIGYYIHTNDWNWEFYRHFREPDRVDEYRLTAPSGQHLFLLRNIDQWNFDLRNPATYQTLTQSMRDAEVTSANIFLLKQVPGPADPPAILKEQAETRKLAAHEGLRVTSIYDDAAQADVTLIDSGAKTTTSARVFASEGPPALIADPAAIVSPSGLGQTRIVWRAPSTMYVEIHVGSPDGVLFASSKGSGSSRTGLWLKNGMQFFLQNRSDDKPLTAQNTLATVRIEIRSQ